MNLTTILFDAATPILKPPTGKNWLILSGVLRHINGTTTYAIIQPQRAGAGTNRYRKISEVDASFPDMDCTFPIYAQAVTVGAIDYIFAFAPNQENIVTADEEIVFSGDATAGMCLQCLEFAEGELSKIITVK